MRLISSIKLSKEIVSVTEVIVVMVLIESTNSLFKFSIKIHPKDNNVKYFL
jgi:hypothetical protein